MPRGGNRVQTAIDRREEIASRLAAGESTAELAMEFHVTERAIQRDKERLGLTRNMAHQWTPEELRVAKNLLEDGCPYTEVARTLGMGVGCVKHRFPGMGSMGTPLCSEKHMRIALELGLTLLP